MGFHLISEFIATHIQFDELNKTKDNERREKLLRKFVETTKALIPTESFVIGVSSIGHAKINKEDNLAQHIKNDLDGLNNGKPNNIQDALIAEVAAVNNFILVTADCDLAQVARKYSINCVHCS